VAWKLLLATVNGRAVREENEVDAMNWMLAALGASCIVALLWWARWRSPWSAADDGWRRFPADNVDQLLAGLRARRARREGVRPASTYGRPGPQE